MIVEYLRTNAWLLLIGSGFLLVMIWVVMRGRLKAPPPKVFATEAAPAQAPAITAREQIERQNQARGMGRDLERLMGDIEQMTQRVGAQLDAKASELEKLLEEARQRIAQLEQITRSAAMPQAVGRGAAAEPEPVEREPEDPVARDVYRLADSGHDSDHIARTLNEHVGKVELILALREA